MDGIVTVLKPPGMTSSNAVYDVRRIFQEKRVGHTGTLDPGAAGVLPICLGRATKLFDYLVEKQKEYITEIAFGCRTDTQDSYGTVTACADCNITREMLADILPQFTGEVLQTAPGYSALKVDGRKMYDLARAGEEIPERIRRIEVKSLELVDQIDANRFLLRLECSRGTYVRTLCEDIGNALDVPAYMAFLLRTRSGGFSIDGSYTIAQLERMKQEGALQNAVESCESTLSFLPELQLPPDRLTATKNGLDTYLKNAPDGTVRVYCEGFLGIGEVWQHRLKLTVHLY